MLYRKDGTQFDKTQFCEFDVDFNKKGCQSKLFINEDTLLKLYKIDSDSRFRIKPNMFETIKKMNDKNLVTLYEYFYQTNSKFNRFFSIDAYTMKLVDRRDGKLIDAERKEILEIIKSLDETIQRLSNLKIKLNDLKNTHLIPTDNGITIIDPDMFYKSISTKQGVYNFNKGVMLVALNSLFYYEFGEDYYQIEPLFFQNIPNQTLFEIVNSQLQEDTLRENQIQKKKRR